MKTMMQMIYFTGFLVLFLNNSKALSAQTTFKPYISNSVGEIWVEENQSTQVLKHATNAKLQASWGQTYITSSNAKLRLELSPSYSLMIFSDSVVKIESDKKIVLSKGSIRTVQQSYGYTSAIQTPVSELSLNFGDYYIGYDASLLQLETLVFKGGAIVQGLGQEMTASLEASYKTYFQAEADTGKPIFDTMLSGVKIIRGKLTPPIKMTEKQSEQFNKIHFVAKPDYEKIKKATQVKIQKLPNQICEAPFAEFNQCAYHCQNNPKGEKTCRTDLPQVSCERKKCNANGSWVEEMRLPAQFTSFCESPQVVVGPCYGY